MECGSGVDSVIEESKASETVWIHCRYNYVKGKNTDSLDLWHACVGEIESYFVEAMVL